MSETVKPLLLNETGQRIVEELRNISEKIGGGGSASDFSSDFSKDFGAGSEETAASPMIAITYAKLKELRDGGKLVPGMQYRITDYECTTTQENTQSAGHQFDIIVVADSKNTLNENARACRHKGDEYFNDANLSAWKLKYCLDNDTKRFAWARREMVPDVKAIVVYEDDPTTTYIHVRYPDGDVDGRFAWAYVSDSADVLDFDSIDLNDYDGNDLGYTDTEDIIPGETIFDYNRYRTPVVKSNVTIDGKGVIYYMKDEWNNECPYDFKNIQFNGDWGYYAYTFNWINDESDNSCEDLSVMQFAHNNDEGGYTLTYGNTIKPYGYNEEGALSYGFPYRLNFIIFRSSQSFDGELFYGCYNNTFGNDCHDNTFGNGCAYNTFGNGCAYNTFGDSCSKKHLDSTSSESISGRTPEYWFNGEKKW